MITAVVIDSREPDWIQRLTFGNVPTMVQALEHGDLLVATDTGEMLLIERKTSDDLLNSLADKRLFNQLADMQDVTRWSYLVITGTLQHGAGGKVITDRGETGWSWSAVQGALLTAQEMGIFVIQAGNDAEYETCVQWLSRRDRTPDMMLEPAKFPHILSAQEQIIASLPGIGMERMTAVLQAAGTPAWALVALTDPTSVIPGCGKGVKTKVRASLGLRDTELMTVMKL
jgi:ERCC4-type nuclease